MKIYRRDSRNHASPNSAQTEAAMAGALDVQLAGNAYYFGKLYEKPTIGDPIRPVEIEDIPRANKLLYATCIVGIHSNKYCGQCHQPTGNSGWNIIRHIVKSGCTSSKIQIFIVFISKHRIHSVDALVQKHQGNTA